MEKKLVIVGAGNTAEIVCTYFKSANRQIAGFAVESKWLNKTELFGLPIVAVEDIEERFPCAEHDVFVALASSQLNRQRARLFELIKNKGYDCASYVSPHAFLDKHASLGENVFVFENNVIQYNCSIGDNTILWSGNHIGHETTIGRHVFISSHVVVAGFCKIGDYCFLGINSSVGDHVEVGEDCTLGAGSSITKNLASNSVVRPQTMNIREDASRKLWKVR